jgi:hypothetical protein
LRKVCHAHQAYNKKWPKLQFNQTQLGQMKGSARAVARRLGVSFILTEQAFNAWLRCAALVWGLKK